MQVIVNSTSVRTMAVRVEKKYPELNKPFILEVLAAALGHRNFDTLSGVLKAEQAPVQAAASTEQPVFQLEGTHKLWMDCFSCGEEGEAPDWVLQEVDESFLQRVLALSQMVREQGLAHASVALVPSDWHEDEDEPLNVRHWSVYVTEAAFWFRGQPKYGSPIETYKVSLTELLAAFSGTTTQWLREWGGQYFASAALNVVSLFNSVVASWGIDEDQMAEWVGLHYGLPLDRLPTDEYRGWLVRYHEAHAENA